MDKNVRLKKEFRYLEPFNAMSLAKLPLLTNIYNYPGRDLSDPKKILNPTEALVQSLFHIPGESDNPSHFQVSPLASKVGRYLGPATLGKIVKNLIRFNHGKEASSLKNLTEKQIETLKAEVKKTIEEDPDFRSRLEDSEKKAKTIKSEIAHLELQQDPEETDTALDSLRRKLLAETYKEKYLKKFVSRLVKAWVNENTEDEFQIYPPHFTEQILLALAWKNSEDFNKRSFLEFYDQNPDLLQAGEIPGGSWLDDYYEMRDYGVLVEDLSMLGHQDQALFLLNHPSSAALLAQGNEVFYFDALPELSTKKISHEVRDVGIVRYSDCMEATLLNIFAIVFMKEGGTWNTVRLEDSRFELLPQLREFIKKYPHAASLDSEEAHRDWALMLADRHPFEYVQRKYEMNTSVSNLFRVFDFLLFPDARFSSLPSHSQKLDHFCEVFSRPGKIYGWNVQPSRRNLTCRTADCPTNSPVNECETDLNLTFTVDQVPQFCLYLSSFHAYIVPICKEPNSIKFGLGPTQAGLRPKWETTSAIFYSMLWSSHPLEIREVLDQVQHNALQGELLVFDYALPLRDDEHKVHLIQKFLKSQNPVQVGRVKKLIERIPLDSVYLHLQIVTLLRKSPYRDGFADYLKQFSKPYPIISWIMGQTPG
jgi:hypothetical protein